MSGKKQDWMISVDNSSVHTAGLLVFFTLLAYVLWKNHQVETPNAAWNGILLIIVLMLWLACLFQLTGFIGYKFKAWKRHPRWTSLFEERSSSAKNEDEVDTEEYAALRSRHGY